MTSYSKGRRFEYRVKKHLVETGWVVFRSSGSHGVADLVALRAGEVWLVQCRVNGYMAPVERIGFVEVARELGVVPVIAYREGRTLVIEEVRDGA
jgi:Holliday junction resolvase